MSKEKEEKFGDVIVSSVSLTKACSIRSFINTRAKYWLFVVKNKKTGKYNVCAQNVWGSSLNGEELHEVKSLAKEAKSQKESQ